MKGEKKKIKKQIVILSFIIIIFLQMPCFARYYEILGKMNGKARIAEPIVKVESLQDTMNLEMNRNIEEKEYHFIIKNYEVSSTNNKKISEVDFSYNIEIKCSNNNFPVKYELIDCSTGEIVLNNSSFEMKKNIEYEKEYKLVVKWSDVEGEINLNNNIDINIKVLQMKA